MCLAVVVPAGAVIPDDALREGWISNPDGGGYGYVNDEGNIVTRKGFFKLREFEQAYKEDAEKFPDSPFLVHFRIATMGTKGPENTHPFALENAIMIHNGTLTGTNAKYNEGKSDTALFAEKFSKDLTFDFVYANKTQLDSSLDYNKVAILYKDKRWLIINERSGVWDGDVWYSNRSYVKSNYHWYNEGFYDD